MTPARRRLPAIALLASAAWLALPGVVFAADGAPIVPDAAARAMPVTTTGVRDAPDDADANQITVRGRAQLDGVATDVKPEVQLGTQAIRALDAADLSEVFQDFSGSIGSGDPVVLVNGQRINGFQTIKSLPPEAVLRIDVFPEKVALQYGYRPDQRVVNVVLRSPYRALSLLGRTNVSTDNGRGIYRAKADLVRIGDNGHWNLDVDYRHLNPVYGGHTVAAPDTAADGSVPSRTIAAQSDALTILGDAAHNFGTTTAEISGKLDLTALQARPGLADDDAALLVAQGSPGLVVPPVRRVDRTVDANIGLTVNGRLANDWRWSFVGNLDQSTHKVLTGPGEGRDFDAILLASPGVLGNGCPAAAAIAVTCASTTTRSAGGDAFLNGDLFALPAGAVTLALRAGAATSDIVGTPVPADGSHRRTRDEGNVQGNVDVPLSAANSALGKITVGANGELRQLSDFGSVPSYGGTFDWTPVRGVDLLASLNHEEQAPSLTQLAGGTIVTPELREYDFAADTTTIVSRIEGGNPDLVRQRSQVARVRLQVKPLATADLLLSGEYTGTRTRDPIVSVSAATDATIAAFPTRFTRSATGYLTALDVSPVNLDRRDTQQIRWGLTYTGNFGPARPGAAAGEGARDQFQIALYDTWTLRDRVTLRVDLPGLDLLHGDIIGDTGGTARHRLELQTSLTRGSYSINVNTSWQTPTHADLTGDRLTFSAVPSLDLRFRVNLTRQPWLAAHVPWLHGNLNIAIDNVLGTHIRVRDATGAVPLAYETSYVNPTGRTFRLTFRKRFH